MVGPVGAASRVGMRIQDEEPLPVPKWSYGGVCGTWIGEDVWSLSIQDFERKRYFRVDGPKKEVEAIFRRAFGKEGE